MLTRWLRFNVVGLAGCAVQLVTLRMLAGPFRIPYLTATALAVEIAILHNFVWHETWTWRGIGSAGRSRRLVRFHLGNGILSIVSNVVFTWVFRQFLGLPLLAANCCAIATTAILNFLVAYVWVFS
ncbi:MAG TPA: GtrA family protein [Bryobacteraceae bacterium]|nr:GtrA family protein [Bryobacteraceae bacterium]